MNNGIKKGMYVRTKSGVGKIDKTRYFLERYEFHLDSNKGTIHNVTDNTYWTYEHDIIGEPSFNIIDLIEVGDYVNGVEVIDKEFDNFNEEYVQCGVGDYVICTYEEKEIETIVTKEQFKSMEYRLGDK